MCVPAPQASAAIKTFDPGAKCCTYLPTLWNFLVGRILEDRTPEAAAGRVSVERRIDAGDAVTLLGLAHTPVFTALYQHVSGSFGRTRALLCPHFLPESGGCGVWRHRESTCATWFCKLERGKVSEHFWNSLHRLLASAELAVARWCAIELNPGAEALEVLFPARQRPAPLFSGPEDFDGRANPEEHRRRWGRWAGREREFYIETARLAGPLSWEAIERIGGVEVSARAERVRAAFAQLMSGVVPDRLHAGLVHFEAFGEGTSLVRTYSDSDPLLLPDSLIGALRYFDGRPNAEVLEEIGAVTGLEISPGLVRRLADFGVLRTNLG
jgi:hypothetical protein